MPMDCDELDQLWQKRRDALLEWECAGGTDVRRTHLPKVLAANKKILDTVLAIIQHRREHGCCPLAPTEEQIELSPTGNH